MRGKSAKQFVRGALAAALGMGTGLAVFFAPMSAGLALANPEFRNEDHNEEDGYPAFFDISERVVSVRAGESCTLSMYSRGNYTYYITGSKSSKTYCECNFQRGNGDITLHIGEDEPIGNVFFHFYYDNSNNITDDIEDGERYATVEVYVQPRKAGAAAAAPQANPQQASASTASAQKTQASKSWSVGLPGGKIGSMGLISDDTIAMLYDENGTPNASFSVSDGSGHMPVLTGGGALQYDDKGYFTINTKKKTGLSLKISDSDKAVMLKKGYAGVCLNGSYVAWP